MHSPKNADNLNQLYDSKFHEETNKQGHINIAEKKRNEKVLLRC